MSLKFTSTKQKNRAVKCLGYGESGVGKTTLCATAPTPLILSTENGLLSLADVNIPVIELSSVDECFEALEFIESSYDAKHFETICLDSSSDIAEIILSEHKKNFKDPRQAYSRLQEDVSDLLRGFRAIPDKHVYCIAKILSITDEYSGLMKYTPSMPGKALTRDIPFMFDEVLAHRIALTADGSSYRYLQTGLDAQYIAKDRSGKLAPIEEPNLTKLFNKILNVQEDKQQKELSVEEQTNNITLQ